MAASRQDLIAAIKDGDLGHVREVVTSSGLEDEPDLKGYLLLVAIEEDQEGEWAVGGYVRTEGGGGGQSTVTRRMNGDASYRKFEGNHSR